MTWKETDTDMKYRRLTGVMVSIAFLGLLTGCAGKESTEQRYAYPLGTASPEDTVTQIYAEKFAEEADRLSDGRIKITVYPNSVLGGDRELLESCYDGDIPFVVQNTAPQVNFIDDTAIFDAPCVFDDIEELRDKIDQPEFLSRMQEPYRDAGYELLGYADQGFRVMSSNNDKFLALADRKKEIHDYDLLYLVGDIDRIRKQSIALKFLQVTTGTLVPTATVVLKFGDHERMSIATGNGPVDAAVSAIKKLVNERVTLSEFLMQAVTRGSDDVGRVHVQVECGERTVHGFAAHTDTTRASVEAFLDALRVLNVTERKEKEE